MISSFTTFNCEACSQRTNAKIRSYTEKSCLEKNMRLYNTSDAICIRRIAICMSICTHQLCSIRTCLPDRAPFRMSICTHQLCSTEHAYRTEPHWAKISMPKPLPHARAAMTASGCLHPHAQRCSLCLQSLQVLQALPIREEKDSQKCIAAATCGPRKHQGPMYENGGEGKTLRRATSIEQRKFRRRVFKYDR